MKICEWDPGTFPESGKQFSPKVEVYKGVDMQDNIVIYTPIKDKNGNELYEVASIPGYEYNKQLTICLFPITNGEPDIENCIDGVMFNADCKDKDEFIKYLRTFHLTVASACVWLYGTNKSKDYELSNHVEEDDYDHFILSIVKNILRSDPTMHCINFKLDFIRKETPNG